MDPLELVRSRNRADITLPSGLGATIGLVRMQDAVMAGMVPVPILSEMDKLATSIQGNGQMVQDVDPKVVVGMMKVRHEMVRRTLKRLAPSVAELDGPDLNMPGEVIDELDQEDFDVIAGYAMRDVPFPGGEPFDVKALAAFASSDEGLAYARVCEFWGRDPAAFLQDDLMAHNLRVGLLVAIADHREMADQDDPVKKGRELVEATRAAGQRLRDG